MAKCWRGCGKPTSNAAFCEPCWSEFVNLQKGNNWCLRCTRERPEGNAVFCSGCAAQLKFAKLGGNATLQWDFLSVLDKRNPGLLKPGLPLPLQGAKKAWPHKCPRCGAPAFVGLVSVDCSKECEQR